MKYYSCDKWILYIYFIKIINKNCTKKRHINIVSTFNSARYGEIYSANNKNIVVVIISTDTDGNEHAIKIMKYVNF